MGWFSGLRENGVMVRIDLNPLPLRVGSESAPRGFGEPGQGIFDFFQIIGCKGQMFGSEGQACDERRWLRRCDAVCLGERRCAPECVDFWSWPSLF